MVWLRFGIGICIRVGFLFYIVCWFRVGVGEFCWSGVGDIWFIRRVFGFFGVCLLVVWES